ncbi:desmethylxanthohumol 6'-O-methyltransferase-like [Corylus avellana]|uniref:desmethylxanthohumol 6'-O-methyltransferase-like n=1 Tax=Corylus avellana TaxID=13451 RepID=UPI00286CD403|nr:desmethylxanthohumol 6'-O-methyltransferase-like [Corylus avellana]
MEPKETPALLQGQAEIWQLIYGSVDSMALKCVVELRIADIIHSHGGPITLRQIASEVDSPSPSIAYLVRIMRLLVRKNIFTEHHHLVESGETLYGLTQTSRWLLRDAELSIVPLVLLRNHPMQLAPLHCLSQSVKKGGTAFKKVHGCEVWDFTSKNPEYNNIFNDAMACMTKSVMAALLAEYNDGFGGTVGSLVDVGGGIGGMMAKIVKAHPCIKGVNFDLPHVVAITPVRQGVSQVGGDMFDAIPNTDAILVGRVLHNWSDEDCMKILKNCRKAIPKNGGNVIIVHVVLEKESKDLFDETRMAFDLLMMAYTTGGKERTELKLLEEAGFGRYKIFKIATIPSIVEAYPE